MSGISNHDQVSFHFSYVELDNLLNRDVKEVHGILSNYVNNIQQLTRVQRDCLKSKLKQISNNKKLRDIKQIGLERLQITTTLDNLHGFDRFHQRIEGWNLKSNIFDKYMKCTTHSKFFNENIENWLPLAQDKDLSEFLLDKALENGCRPNTVKGILLNQFSKNVFMPKFYLK